MKFRNPFKRMPTAAEVAAHDAELAKTTEKVLAKSVAEGLLEYVPGCDPPKVRITEKGREFNRKWKGTF